MDHGIETPAERLSAGKDEQGTILFQAVSGESGIEILVSDDGRGLALAKIKQKAIAAGLIDTEQSVGDSDIGELIFHSGLSTSASVSDVSGRGVGMDAVRAFLEEKGGKITIFFRKGSKEGAEFRPFGLKILLPA
jgi:chemotaxis protein histidine kinase CheA